MRNWQLIVEKRRHHNCLQVFEDLSYRKGGRKNKDILDLVGIIYKMESKSVVIIIVTATSLDSDCFIATIMTISCSSSNRNWQ